MSEPRRCPYCGSADIAETMIGCITAPEHNVNEAFCENCGARWPAYCEPCGGEHRSNPSVVICHWSQREQAERILGVKLEQQPRAIW